jgi:hypothetical protein
MTDRDGHQQGFLTSEVRPSSAGTFSNLNVANHWPGRAGATWENNLTGFENDCRPCLAGSHQLVCQTTCDAP